MGSLRSQEGYLLMDHRVSGGTLTEVPTVTCCHCNRVVILNPQRTRPRHYCPKCNAYACDECHEHVESFEALIDRVQNDALKRS